MWPTSFACDDVRLREASIIEVLACGDRSEEGRLPPRFPSSTAFSPSPSLLPEASAPARPRATNSGSMKYSDFGRAGRGSCLHGPCAA